MANAFSQGYMRGNGDPNLDLQIQGGGAKIPKLYIDDLTDSIYNFDDSFPIGEKWVLLFSGFATIETDIKVLLRGPRISTTMNINLNTKGLLPIQEPYESQEYNRVGFKGESVSDYSVFTNNNIVDWVLVELRDKNNSEILRYTRAALLRNDGKVMDIDGITPLTFQQIRNEPYFLSIKHRNHLGVMTKNPINISSFIDFSNPLTEVFGFNASRNVSGIMWLRGGKFNRLGYFKLKGLSGWEANFSLEFNNDTTSHINDIYSNFDVNMDGNVIFAGGGSDRTAILSAWATPERNLANIEQIPPLLETLINDLVANPYGNEIQIGTTAQRNYFSLPGTQRYNADDNKMEYYNGTTWIQW